MGIVQLGNRLSLFLKARQVLTVGVGTVQNHLQRNRAIECRLPRSVDNTHATFRDHADDLRAAGARRVLGISTQSQDYQSEAAARLHLPFPLLSDAELHLTRALDLPTMEVEGMSLIRRLTLIARDGRIEKVFFPVFPPDRNASDVLAWLRDERPA